MYASGPRRRYQCTILLVPFWLLVIMLSGLGFCVWHGFDEPRHELKMWTLRDMLVAANWAPKMRVMMELRDDRRREKESKAEGVKGSQSGEVLAQRIYLRRNATGNRVLTGEKYFALDGVARKGRTRSSSF